MDKLDEADSLDLGKRARELADEADELRQSQDEGLQEDPGELDSGKRLDDALRRLRELAE
jgi:hypothetical protein